MRIMCLISFILLLSIVLFKLHNNYPNRILALGRTKIRTNLNSPSIFIDNNRTILDANENMLNIIKLKIQELRGCSISEMSNDIFIGIDIFLDGIVRTDIMQVNIGDIRKQYKIDKSIVNDKKFKKVGQLITLVEMKESKDFVILVDKNQA